MSKKLSEDGFKVNAKLHQRHYKKDEVKINYINFIDLDSFNDRKNMQFFSNYTWESET